MWVCKGTHMTQLMCVPHPERVGEGVSSILPPLCRFGGSNSCPGLHRKCFYSLSHRMKPQEIWHGNLLKCFESRFSPKDQDLVNCHCQNSILHLDMVACAQS